MTKKVLVAGASGLVGQAALQHFAAQPGWEAVGISRRTPAGISGATFVPVDLTDADASHAAFSRMSDVTHLVYAAVQEVPGLVGGWFDDETIERNAAMLRNVVEPLTAVASNLEHVSLLQGTKAYGVHLRTAGADGPRIPLRERDSGPAHRNFYFEQERYLRAKQAAGAWSMTVFRPTVIYGDAAGNNMNPLLPIAVYAALLRDEGRPLDFPGESMEPSVREAVDAELVARALHWAATAPSAAGQTYNLTNGDVFSWSDVWPAIAGALGMAPGVHRHVSLADELPRRGDAWAALVEKHGLVSSPDVVELVGANSLTYADMMLRGAPQPGGRPVLNSTIAARQAGFHDCLDTELMFVHLLQRLQADRIIPPAGEVAP